MEVEKILKKSFVGISLVILVLCIGLSKSDETSDQRKSIQVAECLLILKYHISIGHLSQVILENQTVTLIKKKIVPNEYDITV